jgi:micrococcal nuclease
MRNKPKLYSILLIGLVLLLASLIVGCATTPTSVPSAQSPSATESPPESQPTQELPTTLVEVKVVRVIDGDTIEVDIGGSSYKVRYIGIDTPETVHPQKPVECFGKEASDKNKELVEGKIVRLEKDVSETDRYGRLLRYVWVDGIFVNDYLVRQGYAYAYTYPPDVKYAEQFAQAQREARENNRGLWAACQGTTTPPSPISELSLNIISVTSPVSPGAYATLKARAPPGAQCTIAVYYKSGPSQAQGLYPKQADMKGDVSWTWEVGEGTTPGNWRIVITAAYNGETLSQETYFTVQ